MITAMPVAVVRGRDHPVVAAGALATFDPCRLPADLFAALSFRRDVFVPSWSAEQISERRARRAIRRP